MVIRRTAMVGGLSMLLPGAGLQAGAPAAASHPDRRWYEAAAQQKRLAESWGDQPYGAVLVLEGAIVGEGPSRVVKHNDADAHAEREAIRDARRRLGRERLEGSVLYSTSRPCSLCEAAAAQAGVRRMYFGSALADAGVPRAGGR
jgi:tRNA(Arg) A34 adenosine deaminase TadA